MSEFERDLLKVRCGAGGSVLQKRRAALAGFRMEFELCKNPFRQEVLASEITKLARELSNLEEEHAAKSGSAAHAQ